LDRAPSAADPNLFHLVWIAYGVAGFCALAYQVIWTRILIFVLTTTVYAFATMLTAFLAGLALGSLASARWLVPRMGNPLRWFGALQLLVGLAALGSVPLLANLGAIDAGISGQVGWGGFGGLTVTYLANNFVVLLLPTFLMGAMFPVVTAVVLRGQTLLGRRVGQIYAANTIGCVAGAWLAGFVLVPLLGTQTSLVLVVGLNLAVGVALLWRALDGRLVSRAAVAGGALVVAAAAFVFVPANIFHRTINLYRNPSRILYLEEHSTATVTVHELPNRDLLMVTDGVDVAGTDLMLRTTQKLQGYLPLCLHPQPRRVLQIGFGSGETTRVGLEFGVEDYSVVEISPAVFNAAEFFGAINRGSPRDPRVRRIIMDGKNHVLLTPRQYDLIMNDSIFPGSSGSAALYTVDHFRRCRERLADGGMLSCWVPLDLRPRELRMILKSFQSVFPHTSFWVASNTLNKQGLILGTLDPLRIDFSRVAALLRRPAIQTDLAEVAIPDVYDLLDCHMVDEVGIRRLVADDPVNTDDRPLLEFSCARRIPWPIRLRQTLAMLTAHRAPVEPYVVNWSDAARDARELDRRFRSTTHVFNGQVAQLADLPKARRTELDAALALSPDDPQVRSCEAELEKEIEDLRALVDAYPRQPTFTVRLAKKLFLALRWEEAARLYEPMIHNHPPPPAEVFTHLAEIRHHFGDAAGAEELLRRGLEVWPRSHQAHDLLAGLLLQTGRLPEARRHIEAALAIQPGDPLLLRHREEIVRRAGAP
jgi:spermidine synthase